MTSSQSVQTQQWVHTQRLLIIKDQVSRMNNTKHKSHVCNKVLSFHRETEEGEEIKFPVDGALTGRGGIVEPS